ncbi:ATP-binding protein [Citrobacter braakii]|uniref:ATP-binding protein n=1 Tax=Citrobacter braakii TaxID=57706 RepID=UPI0009B87447|nr:ATP-binding protein [Citrobacter braakii]EIV2908188.1 ATP-binding protein [Citrobacter braakii]
MSDSFEGQINMSATNISFQVETDRVLEILSKQIYDSPFAMVRENIQNCYDAILMRASTEGGELCSYNIEVVITPESISITDNGIGMSETVLKENFWKAGSSGKNTESARQAGVIGTFGIGAMANFGVCSSLSVTTRALGSLVGYRTAAQKKDLKIGQECISFEQLDDSIPVGTSILATLDSESLLDLEGLKSYVSQFVKFLPVPVIINGELISQQDQMTEVGIKDWHSLDKQNVIAGTLEFSLEVYISGTNGVGVLCSDFYRDGTPIKGQLCLRNGMGSIMGLRSGFGLAPLPVASVYQLGGFADLPFLVPTAGREALTRDSIVDASRIFPPLERHLTEILASHPIADSLTAFQQYVINNHLTALGNRVKIQVQEDGEQFEMGELTTKFSGLQMQSYDGTDPDLIRMFSGSENPLIRISQNQPRRELQRRYLNEILHVPSIPNHATISQIFAPGDLTHEEVSLTFSLARVLRSDYMLDDVDIIWADITHGVPMIAKMEEDKVILTLSRSWPALKAVISHLSTSYDLLDSFTKDLVRVHIYAQIQSFVPSSQRAGLDALQRALERKREIFRLERQDKGVLDPLIADYLSGKVEIGQVLSAAVAITAVQSQHVSGRQVGTVEQVLPDVVNAAIPTISVPNTIVSAPTAASPILRLNTTIDDRLLTTEQELPQLNNYRMFLALSDRLFQQELEFFKWPHSTQVAWAGRRIVYLFTGANAGISLYYDIELRGARLAGDAGGVALATTTIVSNNRILVPVPTPLMNCFTVTDDPIEFYVRFDLLMHHDYLKQSGS